MKLFRNLGPGLLVTAAFIGPGTVTTASVAGGTYGFALLWTIVFAVLATILLQEMAARLGLVARQGLGEAVRSTFTTPTLRWMLCGFILIAIAFGNAAYQTGNMTGAGIGLTVLFGGEASIWVILIALVAALLLFTGTYKIIERALIVLVVLMSVVFLLTAIVVQPSLSELFKGLATPKIPAGGLITVIGLIGTTVVPYNLFLHASSVREKWSDIPLSQALSESRRDTCLSITIGGLITLAILITAAATFFGRGGVSSAAEMARQLEPLLGGPLARITFAIGLFAAGLTSSITAPLAAAYATAGVLGWQRDLKSWRFRAVWITILVMGVTAAIVFGKSPKETILIAQVANGLLLPFIALFLLIVVNRSDLLGEYKNGLMTNLLGGVVVLIATGLGGWKIYLTLFK